MDDIFHELAEVDDYDEDKTNEEATAPSGDVDSTAQIVQPKAKRVVKARPKLNAERLTGPRGIGVLEAAFEGIQFKGKRHELDDLNEILSRLQHWAHRLYPKLNFEDCINTIEDLRSNKRVGNALNILRMGGVCTTQEEVREDLADKEDPFDLLLPPTTPQVVTTLTEEQRARMLKNRLLAEERRMERMKAAKENSSLPGQDIRSPQSEEHDFMTSSSIIESVAEHENLSQLQINEHMEDNPTSSFIRENIKQGNLSQSQIDKDIEDNTEQGNLSQSQIDNQGENDLGSSYIREDITEHGNLSQSTTDEHREDNSTNFL